MPNDNGMFNSSCNYSNDSSMNQNRDCGCGCGCNNGGLFNGIFGGNDGCSGNSGILFFLIVFLLLFTNNGCCGCR